MAGKTFEDDIGEISEQEVTPKLKSPRKFKVILVNDDYTPMEFVIKILTYFFHMDENTATRIMSQVHTQGQGVCGVFSREIAETKVAQVNNFARSHDYPLLCVMEPE